MLVLNLKRIETCVILLKIRISYLKDHHYKNTTQHKYKNLQK